MNRVRIGRLESLVVLLALVGLSSGCDPDVENVQPVSLTETGREQAYVLSEACNADCAALLHSAVLWLARERGYEAREVILDTLASGTRLSFDTLAAEGAVREGVFSEEALQRLQVLAAPLRERVVPIALFHQLAELTGIGLDNYKNVVRCPEEGESLRSRQFGCKVKGDRGEVLFHLPPPRIRTGELTSTASLSLSVWGEDSSWGIRFYRLAFQKDAGHGWRLVDAKLTGMS